MKDTILDSIGNGLEFYFKHLLWNLGLVAFNMLHAAVHVLHGLIPFLFKKHGTTGLLAYKMDFEDKF